MTTEDTLLDGAVILRQPDEGYRAAVDPVLLAAAVPAKAGDRVVELGMGTGAASLCLAHRVDGVQVVGLEVQAEMAALARANVDANELADRVRVVEGDVLNPSLEQDAFDHVFANPPYLERGTPPPNANKATAHAEGEADLEAWVTCALSLVKRKGGLTFIHRADRLDALIAALHGKAGGITVIPLWPKAGVAAKRVIIRARKGLRSPAILHPGVVLHEADGSYTKEAQALLRGGGAIL